ncbi:MAG TPA: hypothetical protein PKZ97_06060 [Azospirillaceae bacterium]|nr:hypothetical protein [Azospirillaceae bacterium]HRQ80663.1 hypothetical protein [Azospirillaceae bacterium]
MSNEHYAEPAAEDEGEGMTAEQESAMRIMANNLHRLNESVAKCVEAGLTIQLVRTARYHSEAGQWGDQLTPVVKA